MRTGQPAKLIPLFMLLFTITGILPASAQQFSWQTALPAVSETGFYNIALSRVFVAKSHDTALADVRIFDGETVVSYILRHDTPYTVIPFSIVTARDNISSRESVIQLAFSEAYLIQQLQLTITAPAFYKRSLYITEDSSLTDRHEEFTLISGKPASFKLRTPLKTKQCYVIIKNEDNPPLQVTGVTALQKRVYLTAWLEKGKDYVLKTGDRNLPAPVYDLPYFANKLPEKLPVLETGNIEPIPAVISCVFPKTNDTRPTIFKSRAWIWAGIGCIIALISLLTIRLLRDMRERK